MRERAINMRDHEVRAILSGAKTQHRVPVKPQPDGRRDRVVSREHASEWAARRIDAGMLVTAQYEADGSPLIGTAVGRHCHAAKPSPFGAPGDRLWVREAHAFDLCEDSEGNAADRVLYRADHNGTAPLRWRPSIHMPRWASRLTLRVTDVRVERVQDITEEDARAEGARELPLQEGAPGAWWRFPDTGMGPHRSARAAFADLWRDTYGTESWDANSWVWVVSFEREEAGHG